MCAWHFTRQGYPYHYIHSCRKESCFTSPIWADEASSQHKYISGVTKYPTDEWTAQQQLREATPWGKGPKYLIRDRDKKYATHFSAVGASIKELETPYRTPQANGICERFMGSLRRECMDHLLIQDDRYLERVANEYTSSSYFNQERLHQGIEQRIPDQYHLTRSKPTSGRITSKAILGGLHITTVIRLRRI